MITKTPPKLPVPGRYIAVITYAKQRNNDTLPEPYMEYQFVVLECDKLEDCPPHDPGTLVYFPITMSKAIQYRFLKMKVGDLVRVKTFTSSDGVVKSSFKPALRL